MISDVIKKLQTANSDKKKRLWEISRMA